MGRLLQDLRYGLRMMLKSPIVTVVAVLSLALGIAANATMFALLNAFLFEPFPYEDQDGLVMYRSIEQAETSLDMAGGVAAPNFTDYVAGSQSVVDGMVYTTDAANLTGVDTPERLNMIVASPQIFDVLGVPPELGRGFRPEEGVEGRNQLVVLDYDFWQVRFLGDRDILGQTLTLDGLQYTVIGVMPDGFDLVPANVQGYRPSDFVTQQEVRGSRSFIGMGRLADGATPAQAQAEAEAVQARLVEQYPESLRGMNVLVQPAREFFPGPTDTVLLQLLTAVTLFGLLIACANVANLLLSRAEERQREVAVRTALGAGRGRVISQMLTESVMLGTVAGVIGVVLSIWTVRWLQTAMPVEIPEAMLPELDPEVVAATIGLSMLTGIVFGLAPALQAFVRDLREALGNGARGGTAGRRRKRLRNTFAVGEVAVALALLMGSGFLIQAFDQLANAEQGFEADGLLSFTLSVLDDRYTQDEEVVLYTRDLADAVAAIPGVEGVAVMSSLPRGRSNPASRYEIAGRPPVEPNERPVTGVQTVNAAYFETMDVELRSGRLVGEEDRMDTQLSAVVSQALADREFPDGEAIGGTLVLFGEEWSIVGVVENVYQERMSLADRAAMQVYLAVGQRPNRNPSFAIRVDGDPATLTADVRQAVWSVEPDQPIALLRPLQAHIDESLAGPQAIALFLMAMGGIALALAAMGIYGVMAHSVTQQQREIGIRLALGAGQGRVMTMVTRTGLTLVGLGVVIGLPIAWGMFSLTRSGLGIFEADVSYSYAMGFGGALVLVAIIATLLPARRASGVAPVVALKE